MKTQQKKFIPKNGECLIDNFDTFFVNVQLTMNIFFKYRFHVELHFSPGVNCCVQKNVPEGPGFRPNSRSESSKSIVKIH
jgi:hypothetical protein